MCSKSPGMEGKHRVAGWDRKESTPCLLRRLHKRLQFELFIFYATIDSFEDYVEPTDEVINDFSFQFFFVRRNRSLVRTIHPSASTRGYTCRPTKINNAGQRQWWQLMAQRHSLWRARPDTRRGGGGGGTRPKFGYGWAAEGLKPWPCLGRHPQF